MPTGTELGRPIEILLVEDSPTDAHLTMLALRENLARNNVSHVEDGEQAMAFLRGAAPFAQARRPDLVLLDLNLPKMDGREVLREIRADPQLRSLVVVILSTSRDERDILTAYGLNSNMYISKPVDFHEFIDLIKSVKHFCFTVIALPSAA